MESFCTKFYLSALFFILAIPLMAQTEKGNFVIAGAGSWSYEKDEFRSGNSNNYKETSTVNNLNFGPSMGYFVTRGLLLGVTFNYFRRRYDSRASIGDLILDKQYTVGPFVKYYLKNGLFGFFDTSIGRNDRDFTNEGLNVDVDIRWIAASWRTGVGYAIFLSEHISLEPSVAFQHNSIREKGDRNWEFKDSNISIGLGLNMFIGN